MRLDGIRARALLLVAVPSFMLVLLLAAFTFAQRRQTVAQHWSHHASDVLDEAQQLLAQLAEAQTAVRGFIIARDPVFLEPYLRARAEIPGALARLRALTVDNEPQHARMRTLEQRTTGVLAHYEQVLDEARLGRLTLGREREVITRGKALMDEIRAEGAVFRTAELHLEEARRSDVERADTRLFAVVVGGTGAALFAAVALGIWFDRRLSDRIHGLTDAARSLADGGDAGPAASQEDELTVLDKALRAMAAALALRQRAAVGALADAVTLFSAAGTRRAVLDVAADRAIALAGAGVALCTLEGDVDSGHEVIAAVASANHPSAAPAPGTSFGWDGPAEVMRTGRPTRRTAQDRANVPPHVERVLADGEWIGVPLSDDRRTPIGVLQVAAPPGQSFLPDDYDVIGTLAQAASVALALEQSRQRLEAANADLALTNRENELFIYSVSHDLRSPLVNLEGFSRELSTVGDQLRTLVNEPDVPESVRSRALTLIEEDVAESVRFIRTAVGRLAAIIDGLLRLSRAGRVEYRIQPLPLTRILQRIIDSMHATMAAAAAEVRVEALPEIAGDALAIEQLFANLIGNALAYARPGTPSRIEIAAEDDLSRSPRFAVIRVSDNGLGIPEAHLEKVFQPLQRLHPGVGRGEGMGLAIVRRIVERHDGRVWVRSEVGAGTTFYIELPRVLEGATTDAA